MNDLEFVKTVIDQKREMLVDVADRIWNLAELPYAENESSEVLCSVLEQEGFTVQRGVAEIPTSFTATWGKGKPVMGFLGEYDALDILSQKAGCSTKAPVSEGAPGHGCGHNLLGTGSLGAALALKEYLVENKREGTVIYYGCAAEEGAGAKQFMARAGLFDDADFVYTWHPSTQTTVSATRSVAIMGANFHFKGITSHAGGSPELGRSALDAAELMSVGVNYLREHIIDQARIHYAYTDAGGVAPNVVQDHASVKYEVRSPRVDQLQDLFRRVTDVARGAAMMTETEMHYEITMAFSDYIPNDVLAEIASDSLVEIGSPQWDDSDFALAREFLNSYNESTLGAIKNRIVEKYGEDRLEEILQKPLDPMVHPFDLKDAHYESGSTDVGDVGYVTPTLNLNVATCCIGNVGHTWQMTAQSGSAIGHKGMIVAAKAMALAAIRTMKQPDLIEQAKQIVLKQNGGHYVCPLPAEVKPPVGRY